MQVNDLPMPLVTEMMYKVYNAYVIKVFQPMFIINIKIHTHGNKQFDLFNILLYQKNIDKLVFVTWEQ